VSKRNPIVAGVVLFVAAGFALMAAALAGLVAVVGWMGVRSLSRDALGPLLFTAVTVWLLVGAYNLFRSGMRRTRRRTQPRGFPVTLTRPPDPPLA
jgi:hypothetical protein